MATTAEHRAVEQDSNALRALWPLVATIFLIGIGLVSLADILSDDVAEPAYPAFPEEMGSAPTIVIAPGAERVLAELPSLERAKLHPPWERLPEIGERYFVVTTQGELPRLPDGWRVAEECEEGDWTISQVDPPEDTVQAHSYDLSEHISEATVFYQAEDGSTIPCDHWSFRRWECGLQDWHWVGVTEVLMRDQNRRCIWAHPATGYVLNLRFSDVPVGNQLGGRYGIADSGIGDPEAPTVEFDVRVGSVSRSYSAGNRRGFHSYQLAPESVGAGTAEVEFAISAEHDGMRHFCFTAVMHGTNEGAQSTPEGAVQEPMEPTTPPLEINPENLPVPLERDFLERGLR